MGRKFIIFAMVIIVALAGIWYFSTPKKALKQPSSSFILASFDGKMVEAGNPGKITVINFWTTWCPPCREEMPELNRFFHNKEQDIVFFAINMQEPAAKVKDFMDKNSYNIPVLLDTDGVVAKRFQINSIPTTLVLDKNGVIRYRKAGGLTSLELETVIKGL